MSFIDFSKIKMLQKKPKTLGEKLQAAPVVARLFAVLILLSVAGTGILSLLQQRTGAQTESQLFTKLVAYQHEGNRWVDYAQDANGIDAFAVNGLGYLLYKTGDGRLFGRTAANTATPGLAAQVVNYPGNSFEIVDITAGNNFTFALEKNGRIYYTNNNASTWSERTQMPYASNNAKSIGTDGCGGEIVIYGNGRVGVFNGSSWTDYGINYNPGVYGEANSGDIRGGPQCQPGAGGIFLGTNSGHILFSGNYSTYSSYYKFASGNYVYPAIWDLFFGGIGLAYPIDADRRSNVFVQFVGTPGGTGVGDTVYLRATIPGCRMGKMAQYVLAGGAQSGFLANIVDNCDPNAPTPPPVVTPGGGETIVSSTTNSYAMETKGVSIHTRVAGPDGTATVKRGENATFTLTVNNPDATAKNVTVRFLVPQGFSFTGVVPPTPGVTRTEQVGGQTQLVWENYSANPGSNNFLTINTTAPTQ